MVWEWNFWTISAVAIVSGGLLYSLYIWRQHSTERFRDRVKSNLIVRERIQEALLTYHDKFREWPTRKSQIASHLKVTQEQLDWIKTWDFKLVKISQDRSAAHYSIMVTGTWLDWISSPFRSREEISV